MEEQASYSPLARQVAEIIRKYCSFAQPILETHCRRMKINPSSLRTKDLPVLAAEVGKAVEMFTNPEKGRKTEQEILNLSVF